jgi:hypothetical protein
MTLDQDAGQPGIALPAGWAFGKGSIKAHWFDAGHITSICGRGVNSNLQRANRDPKEADCGECKRRLERRAEGNADD